MAQRQQLKVIDLFAGAGGMTLGFKKAGFKPIFAVEREEDFAKTYAANFGDHIDSRLIEDVVEVELEGVGVLRNKVSAEK